LVNCLKEEERDTWLCSLVKPRWWRKKGEVEDVDDMGNTHAVRNGLSNMERRFFAKRKIQQRIAANGACRDGGWCLVL
jgi:hypothetical protein